MEGFDPEEDGFLYVGVEPSLFRVLVEPLLVVGALVDGAVAAGVFVDVDGAAGVVFGVVGVVEGVVGFVVKLPLRSDVVGAGCVVAGAGFTCPVFGAVWYLP